MPTLHWIGKEKVVNHHQDVPYRILEHKYGFSAEHGEQDTETKSGNKIIHGDNLSALKSLLPEYEGKIKCIYIDPPYNTGNENWVYNDNVNHPKIKKWLGEVVGRDGEDLTRHDKWLCMMYPRLKLLHKLLADDGVIFISIDDNEQANLKLMMDEIFGGGNFVTSIHWKRSESQNNNSKILSIVGEFILTYIKDKNNKVFNKADLKETALKEYRYEDEKGKFRRGTIVDNSRGKNLLTIKSPNGITKTINSIRTKDFFEEKQEEGLIYWTSTGTPYLKLYLDNSEGQISSNWFDDAGVNEDSSEELTKIGVDFQFSKPYSLINKLIKISSSTDALVLDSFSGSGTTAHSVLNLNKQDGGNRKFILIEMEDYANTITAERVKRVMQGYGSGDKAVAGLGGSFDFYELGKPMFKDDKNLNEEIGEDKIREYIYYTETKQYLTRERKEETKYLLDTFNNTAYYFYYEKESLTTLDHSTLNIITELTEQYLVYADICHLDKKYMQEHNIIFKKIPRDIRRF
jgi:adenine-specific DNA-methyltransferase